MLSKTIFASEITPTVLNTIEGYTIDATITITSRIICGEIIVENVEKLPKGIQIVNKTGADLEWLILSDDDEIEMYNEELATPGIYPYFAFTVLLNNSVLLNYNLPNCKRFIIRAIGGVGATSGLRIDFNQYGGRR